MQLGCSVRVMGRPGLHSYDGRRGQHAPHLSVSLVHLRAVLEYLTSVNIRMYRMSADLAPYATHPDYPSLHHQVEECAAELAALGGWVRTQQIRLSFHAPASVVLSALDPLIVAQAGERLAVLADLLDAMALGSEAVIVVHMGSGNGGIEAAMTRWLMAWEQLPLAVQRRVVLEHDSQIASLGVVLRLAAASGVPVVFDHLHWLLHNPEGYSLGEALALALATWPSAVRPKIHFATPRTELRAVAKTDGLTKRRQWALAPPRAGHHSDFIHPWEFARFVEAAATLPDFDVMLEAKASDLALLRLRADMQRYIPQVAAWLVGEPS